MSKSTIVSRGLILSTLSIALVACVNMQAPQPAITSHIPQNFSQNHSGKMIAEKVIKNLFLIRNYYRSLKSV
ncbi:hypothetical protein BANRA_03256 [Acinetobacter baumannii]|nr:hypothetical protein BANRA_00518 [Acinetobacter baumannii]VCX77279.1 hypothetical protein BANRA_03316 [Acinetobacter baumannii]VCZ58706.1 hypothetical protein BANRA_03000 [Acinetobacter baumannii]VDA19975.1 hypothetical protein BANRA_03256 [Acinetobacter baumannii]